MVDNSLRKIETRQKNIKEYLGLSSNYNEVQAFFRNGEFFKTKIILMQIDKAPVRNGWCFVFPPKRKLDLATSGIQDKVFPQLSS